MTQAKHKVGRPLHRSHARMHAALTFHSLSLSELLDSRCDVTSFPTRNKPPFHNRQSDSQTQIERMFAWASNKFNEHLSNIAETLAPPPDTPEYHFLTALKTGSELNYTIQALGDVRGPLNIPNNAPSGKHAIHFAAEYGNLEAVRILLEQYQIQANSCFDYQGNSVLHYAAKSGNLSLVQCLIQTFQLHSLIGITNAGNQTPYDFTEDLKIRQFLLPLQLQEETRQCMANGGVGLMPGIDLGGMKIADHSNSVVAPPPIMTQSQQQGTPQRGKAAIPTQKSGIHSRYVAYDIGTDASSSSLSSNGVGYTNVSSPTGQGIYSPAPLPAPVPAPVRNPTMQEISMAVSPTQPMMMLNPAPAPTVPVAAPPATELVATGTPQQQQQQEQQQQQPPVQNNSNTNPFAAPPLPPPPFYAAPPVFVNRSVASAPRSNPPRERLKPDGFHSSASDKNLQEFYGHVKQTPSADIPPPPMSNGSFSYSAVNKDNFNRFAAPAAASTLAPPPAFTVFQQPAPSNKIDISPSIPSMELNTSTSASNLNQSQNVIAIPSSERYAPHANNSHEYEEDTTADFTSTSSSIM